MPAKSRIFLTAFAIATATYSAADTIYTYDGKNLKRLDNVNPEKMTAVKWWGYFLFDEDAPARIAKDAWGMIMRSTVDLAKKELADNLAFEKRYDRWAGSGAESIKHLSYAHALGLIAFVEPAEDQSRPAGKSSNRHFKLPPIWGDADWDSRNGWGLDVGTAQDADSTLNRLSLVLADSPGLSGIQNDAKYAHPAYGYALAMRMAVARLRRVRRGLEASLAGNDITLQMIIDDLNEQKESLYDLRSQAGAAAYAASSGRTIVADSPPSLPPLRKQRSTDSNGTTSDVRMDMEILEGGDPRQIRLTITQTFYGVLGLDGQPMAPRIHYVTMPAERLRVVDETRADWETSDAERAKFSGLLSTFGTEITAQKFVSNWNTLVDWLHGSHERRRTPAKDLTLEQLRDVLKLSPTGQPLDDAEWNALAKFQDRAYVTALYRAKTQRLPLPGQLGKNSSATPITKSKHFHPVKGSRLWGPNGALRALAASVKQAMTKGDLAKADQSCKKGLQLSPNDPVFKDFLVQIRHRQAKAKEQADFTKAYKAARDLIAAGDLDGAERATNDFLSTHPDEASFKELAKDIASRKASAARAAALEDAIRNITTLVNRKDFAGAAAACNEALRMWPDNEDLLGLKRKIESGS